MGNCIISLQTSLKLMIQSRGNIFVILLDILLIPGILVGLIKCVQCNL